ncbi:MAG: hypothetical protein KQI62_02165 [Deltaproteobacteria bacterium]|nr:hypothetical protein [Deltaproteobacteria bacterium]
MDPILVLEPEKFDEVADKLARIPYGLAKVLEQSLRRASKGMISDASRTGREIYGLKHRTVLADLKILRPWAASGRFEAGVDVKAKARKLSLMRYGVRPAQPVSSQGVPNARRRPKGGPSFMVLKSTGRKKVRRGFVIMPPTDAGEADGPVFFARRGKAKLPIKKLTGPGVRSILRRKQVREAVRGNALDRLYKQLDYNTRGLLRRYGLK